MKYDHHNIEYAKKLRREMTPWERKLWYCFLKNYPIRFQRQKCINNFIADFYCDKAKLVIEIDGSQHFTEEGIKQDEIRTNVIESYGLKIVRIINSQIDTNFKGVCEYIGNLVQSLL